MRILKRPPVASLLLLGYLILGHAREMPHLASLFWVLYKL